MINYAMLQLRSIPYTNSTTVLTLHEPKVQALECMENDTSLTQMYHSLRWHEVKEIQALYHLV